MWNYTSLRSTLDSLWCGCMMPMMECRVSILNEVLQTFKLKNFRSDQFYGVCMTDNHQYPMVLLDDLLPEG